MGSNWFEVSRSKNYQISDKDLNHINCSNKYILIEGLNALHAGVKASQGSFSLPFDGWLVNNKEAISIEAATVAGDIQTLLKNIINLEADQVVTHNGVSPHVWIESLSITGEA